MTRNIEFSDPRRSWKPSPECELCCSQRRERESRRQRSAPARRPSDRSDHRPDRPDRPDHANTMAKRACITYPSLVQNIRWCPYVETACIKKYREDECTSLRGLDSAVSLCRQRFNFKDNIVTFCDKYTMTYNVAPDRYKAPRRSSTRMHGSHQPPNYTPQRDEEPPVLFFKEPPFCDKHPATCDDAYTMYVKDAIIKNCAMLRRPQYQSILKKCCDQEMMYEPLKEPNDFRKYEDDDKSVYCKAVNQSKKRVAEEACENREMFDRLLYNRSRRVLYNEGISDASLASSYFKYPRTRDNTVTWPRNAAVTWSRARLSRHAHDSGRIPYSHTGKSKYHCACKHDVKRPSHAHIDRGPNSDEPGVTKYAHLAPNTKPWKPALHNRKLVVPSEKNIDSFIKIKGRYTKRPDCLSD